jgi:hypothetical protein
MTIFCDETLGTSYFSHVLKLEWDATCAIVVHHAVVGVPVSCAAEKVV